MNLKGKIWLVLALTVVLVAVLVHGLGSALFPLVGAFFCAYLFFPTVQRMESWGIRRNISATAVIGLTLALITAATLYLVPMLAREGSHFVRELPDAVGKAAAGIENLAERAGYPVELNRQSLTTFLRNQAAKVSVGTIKGASSVLSKTFGNLIGTLINLLNLFLFPVFFYYIMVDYEKILQRLHQCFPVRVQGKVSSLASRADRILSGYIRGQIIVCLLLALLYAIGLQSIGLRFGFIIGIVAGLLNIIPYVGLTVGLVTALVTAVASEATIGLYIGVVAIFAVVQTIEGLLITPRIVGDKVGLGALSTMLALIVGGNLLGFLGMIVAIPATAILFLLLGEVHTFYRCSAFYTADRT